MSESVKDKKSQIGLWLAGAMFCLWYLGYIVIQADTKEGAKGVHLEWETPAVSWQELSQARENETAGSGMFFYLWGGQEETFQNPETGQKIKGNLILGLGEMQEALPTSLVSGNYVWDKEGCLVSQSVATALWGRLEVVGQSLEAGDRRLIVRGVAKEQQAIVYCQPQSENGEQEQQAYLECYIAPESAAVETVHTQKALAEVFLARHGLPAPSTYKDYAWQSDLRLTGVRFLIFLPLLIVSHYALSRAHAFLKKKKLESQGGGIRLLLCRIAIWIVVLAILVYVLRWIFQGFTVPEDWIPPAWSDFGFWGEKWREWKSRSVN